MMFTLFVFYLFDRIAQGLLDWRPDLLLSKIRLRLVDRLRSYRFLNCKTKFYNFPNKFSSLFSKTFIFRFSSLSIFMFKFMQASTKPSINVQIKFFTFMFSTLPTVSKTELNFRVFEWIEFIERAISFFIWCINSK